MPDGGGAQPLLGRFASAWLAGVGSVLGVGIASVFAIGLGTFFDLPLLAPPRLKRAFIGGVRRFKGLLAHHFPSTARHRRFNYSKIDESLYCGRQPQTVEQLKKLQEEEGVKAFVSVLEPWEFLLPKEAFGGLDCLRINAADFSSPGIDDVETATKFIESFLHEKKGAVYVHCNAGRGRSGVIVAAYLMSKLKEKDVGKVVKIMREKRPQFSLSLTNWPFSGQSRTLWRYSNLLEEKWQKVAK